MMSEQSLLFVGAAVLQVLQGAVDVCGKMVTPESAPLKLNTTGRNGLAILLTGQALQRQVPFAPSETVEFTLQSPPEPQTSTTELQTSQGGAGEEGHGRGSQAPQQQQQQQQKRRRRSHQQGLQPPPGNLSGEQLQGPQQRPAQRTHGPAATNCSATFSLLPPPRSSHFPGLEGGGRSAEPKSGAGPTSNNSSHFASGSASSPGPSALQLPPDWAAAIACVCDSAAAAAAAAAAEAAGSSGSVGCNAPHEQGPPHLPPVVAVAGAKGVGKSSLSRFLVNHLLNVYPVVAYLGSTSPEQDPGLYLSAISSLFTWYCSPACAAAAAAEADAAAAAASNGTPTPEFVSSAGPRALSPGHHQGSCEAGNQGTQGHGEGILGNGEDILGNVKSEVSRHREGAVGGWPPLVVNMQGWVKGLGFELTVDILKTIGPSHLLQVQSHVAKRNLPAYPFWFEGPPESCPTHAMLLSSPSSNNSHNQQQQTAAGAGVREGQDEDDGGDEGEGVGWQAGKGGKGEGGQGGWGSKAGSMKPVEARALQWHAWAKAAVGWDGAWGTYEGPDLYASASALAARRPYVVSLQDLHVHFMHTGAVRELGVALNGVVVGLAVGVDGLVLPLGGGPIVTGSLSARPLRGQQQQQQQPELPLCVGVGLVRAVDMAQRELFVLTPTPMELLEQVDTLLVGHAAGDLPTSLLQAPSLPAVSPYLSLFGLSGFSGAAAGASGMKGGRKNLGRASLVDTS
ncbi:hypothetical protein DUNSADRAFT_15383 [Dunaliella salina]|uniref:NOL9 C-terminal domain-containing protein n=1 Tax=Dunaliella salina TaxID=3046 RepID=A0ABQ7H1Z4_DUNSA|nr:hypothetical protein DUNSADRAFT_15383 [Dunaliella salina]|eukprot:KAF5840841.1 hypothetical protein DUNSADRAFT_15383 [Dunaliella salina]